MPSYNKVILMGNLTRDVELKYTPNNMAVSKIGLAVNNRFKTKEGEWKDEATFVDCEAWGTTAENISKYFTKGKPILVEGRLKLDTWQDKESGGNRSKLKVVVERFEFVGSKSDGGGGGGGGSGGYGGESGSNMSGSSDSDYGDAPARRSSTPAGAATGASRSAPAYDGPTHEPVSEDDIPF